MHRSSLIQIRLNQNLGGIVFECWQRYETYMVQFTKDKVHSRNIH